MVTQEAIRYAANGAVLAICLSLTSSADPEFSESERDAILEQIVSILDKKLKTARV